jgi:DNA-binding protein Fis
LANLLAVHPEIQMVKPLWPEPKWFLKENANLNAKSYMEAYFDMPLSKNLVYGEKSTSYYEFPKVAENINTAFPESKIIVILRDPVYRALSNYFFTSEHGLETRSLTEVFLKRIDRPKLMSKVSVNPFDYLERGHYLNLLKPYEQVFGTSRLKVIVFEKMLLGVDQVSDIFNYLGVNDDLADNMEPLLSMALNVSMKTETVPDQILNVLSRYYKQMNEELSSAFNLDCSHWL